jgi:hypothetical protein
MGNYWSDGDLPAIPDFTEPIRLYRTFRSKAESETWNIFIPNVERGFYSTSHEYAWSDDGVEAACLSWNGAANHHKAPDIDCSCGFYGYHLPVESTEFAEINAYLAVIEAWGKVIAHPLGARVEHARIVAVTTSHNAEEGDLEWLKESYSEGHIDVGFENPDAMYKKYPPQDVSAFIGTTAIEARVAHRKKQEDEVKAQQLQMLQSGHNSLTGGSPYKVCRCTGCKVFFTQQCQQPGCRICSGELVISDSGYAMPARPDFFTNAFKTFDVIKFPKGSFLNP